MEIFMSYGYNPSKWLLLAAREIISEAVAEDRESVAESVEAIANGWKSVFASASICAPKK